MNGSPIASPIKKSSTVGARNSSPVPAGSDLGYTVISSPCNISAQTVDIKEFETLILLITIKMNTFQTTAFVSSVGNSLRSHNQLALG